MNILTYIDFVRRYLKYVLLITVLFVVLTGIVTALTQKSRSEVTIFLSLGAEDASEPARTDSSYVDLIDAADKFGETIKGWFKNPGFLSKIGREVSGEIVFGSVKKQALQNLVIVFEEPLQAEPMLIEHGQAVLNLLLEEVATYNAVAGTSFKIANGYVSTRTIYPPLKLNLATAVLVGLFLSIVMFYIYELLKGVVSFENQISELFPDSPLFKLSKKLPPSSAVLVNYLTTIEAMIVLARTNEEDAQLSEDIVKAYAEGKSRISDNDLMIVNTVLPQHSELLALKESVLVLLIHPGKTILEDLKIIKDLYAGVTIPVIIRS